MQKEVSLKRLELIHEYICNECQSSISYLMRLNEKIFQRIRNAADILYNNAMAAVLQHRQITKDNFPELTLDTTNEILLMMYGAMQEPDFPVNIEAKIKQSIARYDIDPEQLLLIYSWQTDGVCALPRNN